MPHKDPAKAHEYKRQYRLTHCVSKEKQAEYRARYWSKRRSANLAPPALTQERLLELLHYDPLTGEFRWREDRHCGASHRICAKAGDIAGSVKSNVRNIYAILTIDGRRYYAHRVAWLYMTGSFPPRGTDIDHADADSLNNRFANLRCASRSANIRNSRRHLKSTSGLKGVSWHKGQGKWRAVIRIDGRQLHLGSFDDPELAHAAYLAKAREVFGEFARAA